MRTNHHITVTASLLLPIVLLLSGCMTTQKAANEQARDAYWLAQSDATKQLHESKKALQKLQTAQPPRQIMYYSVPVENPPGMNAVPHTVVIPVEK